MPLGEKTANCTEGIFFIHPQVLDGARKNVFRYAGSASGRMLYNWHRDYNPALGRYDQFDLTGLAGGINGYGYVGGNPLSGYDLEGEQIVIVDRPAPAGGYSPGLTSRRSPRLCLTKSRSMLTRSMTAALILCCQTGQPTQKFKSTL